jgi:hypothetical protein
MPSMLDVTSGTVGSKLQFAHGAPQPGSAAEEVEKIVAALFPVPTDLLAAYQQGLHAHKTSDLVLVVAKEDAEIISAWPRREYIKSALHRCPKAALPRLAHESAHRIAKLPIDSPAFWLVIEVKQLPAPIMTVLYTTHYQSASN